MADPVLKAKGRDQGRAGAPRAEAAVNRAIDLVHLSRQTLGDRGLETELLRLFDKQCAQILGKLEKAACEEGARRDLVHTLKGSARAVGAGAVAEAVEAYEAALDRSQDDARTASALARLKAASEETRRQVAALLAEG